MTGLSTIVQTLIAEVRHFIGQAFLDCARSRHSARYLEVIVIGTANIVGE